MPEQHYRFQVMTKDALFIENILIVSDSATKAVQEAADYVNVQNQGSIAMLTGISAVEEHED